MRASIFLTHTTLGAALLVSAGACSSTSNGDSDHGNVIDAGSVDAYIPPILDAEVCNNHGQEVDVYYPGMKMVGMSGSFDFILESSDPAPPSDPYQNTWILRVVDKTGATVKDATLSMPVSSPQWGFAMNPWMPYMGHGGSVPTTVKNHGDGTATAVPDFNMRDYWQGVVCAQSGSTSDCAKFAFCLP